MSSTDTEASSSSWTVADCVRVLEQAYDPRWAEEWDAVGLVCGSLEAPVSRVHLAIDPTLEVAREAVADGAQLLITHHPLFLRGVHGVAETSPGGRVVATLIRGGCALFTAHTNADVARPGVSDALAGALGLRDLAPVVPLGAEHQPGQPLDKLVAFVPVDDRERLLDALAAAGAGGIGNYDRCGWWATGTGTFRPLDGARPAIGHVGAAEQVAEDRLEMVLPRRARAAVIEALRAAHPYEEPAFDVFELATLPAADAGARGLGRIGDLPAAQPLGEFVERVAAVLPRTAWGVRATGEGDRLVRRIAVCGGSGGELAGPAAALGADVLLTSDARHHYTLDSLAARPLAIVDAAHWATEHPWLSQVKQLLHTRLPAAGSPETRVDPPAATVSDLVTDPWRLHSC